MSHYVALCHMVMSVFLLDRMTSFFIVQHVPKMPSKRPPSCIPEPHNGSTLRVDGTQATDLLNMLHLIHSYMTYMVIQCNTLVP